MWEVNCLPFLGRNFNSLHHFHHCFSSHPCTSRIATVMVYVCVHINIVLYSVRVHIPSLQNSCSINRRTFSDVLRLYMYKDMNRSVHDWLYMRNLKPSGFSHLNFWLKKIWVMTVMASFTFWPVSSSPMARSCSTLHSSYRPVGQQWTQPFCVWCIRPQHRH